MKPHASGTRSRGSATGGWLPLLLLSLTGGLVEAKPLAAANFSCADGEILVAAEAARRRSAEFWSGRELPGDWSPPCPIWVQFRDAPAGGSTTFRFHGQNVFGWNMTLAGRRSEILQDALPHEVDHMVRAGLVRRPIERWLDEGAASLMESPASQARLRAVAARLSPAHITSSWLNAKDYPTAGRDVESLYALGHSLVEFLLSIDTPRKLLEFQIRTGSIESRLQSCYGLALHDVRTGWLRRTSDAAAANSVGDDHQRPQLRVWTAGWCGPCQRFWSDYHGDTAFRTELNRRYQVIAMPFESHCAEARRLGITRLPTFEWADGSISGYRSREELLAALSRSLPADQPLPPTAAPLSVSPNESGVRSPEGATSPAAHQRLPTSTIPIADGDTLIPEIRVPSPRPSLPDLPPPLPSTSSPPLPLQPSPSLFPGALPTVPLSRSPSPPVPSSSVPDARSVASKSGENGPMRQEPSAWVGVAMQVFQWTGLISGSVATGGIAGLGATLLTFVIQRRLARRRSRAAAQKGGDGPTIAAPFPRRLDEACELLELRRTEGRVAVLDALRGMFLQDELEKLEGDETAKGSEFATRLKAAIDARVDEVAPLTTTV